MSISKCIRILKRAAALSAGSVSFLELPGQIIGVTITGKIAERERRVLLVTLTFEAAEWGYKLIEIVEV